MSEERTLKPRGRPPKYRPEMCEEVIEQMSQGALDYEIQALWKISRETFYCWIRENAEFRAAYEEGLAACETWWSNWGKQGMLGKVKGFNFNAWIAFMNNKFKWSKAGPNDASTNINISNLTVLQQQTPAQLIEKITKQLTDLNIVDLNESQYTVVEPAKQIPGRTATDSGNFGCSDGEKEI